MNFKSLLGKTIATSTAEYTVEKLLGTGSFGAVALCSKKPTGEKVAIKFIVDKKSIQKAEEEANILNELKASGSEEHHVVHFNDSFMFKGHFCLEFEKLDTDLFHFCDQGPLTLRQIRPIIKQMAETLCFLDEMGIIHTDLKPENIMMVDRQREPLKIRVIDFGLAVRKPLEWKGEQLQTLAFAAPEVLLGAPLSEAIDVWSVGCIAAELLLGRTLFKADYEDELMDLMVSTIGMPAAADLDVGLYTKDFFKKRFNRWIHKGEGYQRRLNNSPSPPIGLDAILKLPRRTKRCSQEEAAAAECDRASFVDLVSKMLDLDQRVRIRARDILQHPFITMEHLTSLCSSYLESSKKLMEVCCTEDPPAAPSSTKQPGTSRKTSEPTPGPSKKRARSDPMEGPSKKRAGTDPMEGPSKKRKTCKLPGETSYQKRSELMEELTSPQKREKCEPAEKLSSLKKGKKSQPAQELSSQKKGKKSEPAQDLSSLQKGKKSEPAQDLSSLQKGKKSEPAQDLSSLEKSKRSHPMRTRSNAIEAPSKKTKKSDPMVGPSKRKTSEPAEEPSSQERTKIAPSGRTCSPKRRRVETPTDTSPKKRMKT